jgi:alginate O-acetyltransferase complex protein AlgI
MVFSSAIFLFAFLPIFLIGYYLVFAPVALGAKGRVARISLVCSNAYLLTASMIFYYWGEQWLISVMLAATVLDYCAGLGLGVARRRWVRRLLITISIGGNLAMLGFFKYFNFGLDAFNHLVAALGLSDWRMMPLFEITMPLGISFYTFQTMSYTLDVYRGEIPATRNFLNFAAFVTLFPHFIAGPIVRYRNLAQQFQQRTISLETFSAGCVRFVLGLGKKTLIANTVAVPVERIFALPSGQMTPALAWLGVCAYAIQIYYDFSGYSDMAIGLGQMMGFRFPENFNYPYSAQSIQDFWRRWHMTLSSFLRDYLYIPLGGSRGPAWRVYLNLLLVFFVCGLWHGAQWTFVVWGLFHGFFLIVERLGGSRVLDRCPFALRNVYVVSVVLASWVLFRSHSFAQAISFFRSLAGRGGAMVKLAPRIDDLLTPMVAAAILVGAIMSYPVLPAIRRIRDRVAENSQRWAGFSHLSWAAAKLIVLAGTMVLSLVSIFTGTYNPFIYFRF